MSKQKFTQEQVELLKDNPYTEFVSPATIRFTDQFKSEFWEAYLAGKTAREIFQDKGYDVNVIGEKRISNTLYKITKDHSSKAAEASAEDYHQLANEVKRLNYELNVLKKIIALGNSRK